MRRLFIIMAITLCGILGAAEETRKSKMDAIKTFDTYGRHSPAIQAVLREMVQILGIKKAQRVGKFGHYLENNQYDLAAAELKASGWHEQDPKTVDALAARLVSK